MAIVHPTPLASAGEDYEIRALDFNDLRIALRQGWEDFQAKRGDLVFVGFIYPIVVLLAIFSVSRVSMLPFIFPLVAGTVMLGPLFASGFYELARRREAGPDAGWRHFLDVVRGPSAPALLDLASVTAALYMAWIGVAWFIYHATLSRLGPEAVGSAGAFLRSIFTTPEGWSMIVFGNLAGLCFAIVTLAVSAVSFPMVIDKPVSWGVALRTSVRVARRNPLTITVWGLIVVALLVLGALPALVGLAVVLPVLGYSTWHLYTRAVVR